MLQTMLKSTVKPSTWHRRVTYVSTRSPPALLAAALVNTLTSITVSARDRCPCLKFKHNDIVCLLFSALETHNMRSPLAILITWISWCSLLFLKVSPAKTFSEYRWCRCSCQYGYVRKKYFSSFITAFLESKLNNETAKVDSASLFKVDIIWGNCWAHFSHEHCSLRFSHKN